MKLDEVRGLKEDLRRAGRPAARILGRGRPTLPRGVALGVAHMKDGEQYTLAVRVLEESVEADKFLVQVERMTDSSLDVRVPGPVRARAMAPAVGSSVGHTAITAGTLGGYVVCRASRVIGVLSNNHVLADENQGRSGDLILAPGPHDGGVSPDDRIATLDRFVKIELQGSNTVDAAFARLDEGLEPPDLESLPWRGLGGDTLTEDLAVSKRGRTTGETHGIVTAFEVDAIPVEFSRLGTVLFDGCVEIQGVQGAFSEGGDSGSVIYGREDSLAYGLLFAGTDGDDGLTYGNRLADVLEQLDTDLLVRGGAR